MRDVDYHRSHRELEKEAAAQEAEEDLHLHVPLVVLSSISKLLVRIKKNALWSMAGSPLCSSSSRVSSWLLVDGHDDWCSSNYYVDDTREGSSGSSAKRTTCACSDVHDLFDHRRTNWEMHINCCLCLDIISCSDDAERIFTELRARQYSFSAKSVTSRPAATNLIGSGQS